MFAIDALPTLPDRIALEPTNICNMRCRMCFREHLPDHFGFMSLETLKAALASFDPTSSTLPQLCFFWRGEPLLHTSLKTLIGVAHSRGHVTILFTNGLLATEERIGVLFSSGLSKLVFSIDGARATTFANVRGVDGLDRVTSAARAAVAIRNATHARCQIGVNFTLLPDNVDELDSFVTCWSRTVDVVSVSLGVDPTRLTGIQSLAPSALAALGPKTEVIPCHVVDEHEPEVCHYIRNRLWISWRGDVYPCPMGTESIRLGNVHAQLIGDIWRGPAHRQLLAWQASGRTADDLPCGGCLLRRPRTFQEVTISRAPS